MAGDAIQAARTARIRRISGMDAANHDLHGIFIRTSMSDLRGGRVIDKTVDHISCLDVTPTILGEFGLTPPDGVGGEQIASPNPGTSICNGKRTPSMASMDFRQEGFTSEEEEIVKKRLIDAIQIIRPNEGVFVSEQRGDEDHADEKNRPQGGGVP